MRGWRSGSSHTGLACFRDANEMRYCPMIVDCSSVAVDRLSVLLLPLEISLLHIGDDLRDFFSSIEGRRVEQRIEHLGEIVDETTLGGPVDDREHPNRLQASPVGFLNALLEDG